MRTGEVQGKTTTRHTSQDFVGFLGDVVATGAAEEEIHVILVPRRASERDVALHADVLVVAESGGAVVLGGPGAEAAAVHRRLREAGEALPVEARRPPRTASLMETYLKDGPLVGYTPVRRSTLSLPSLFPRRSTGTPSLSIRLTRRFGINGSPW